MVLNLACPKKKVYNSFIFLQHPLLTKKIGEYLPCGEKVWDKVIAVEEFVPNEDLLTSIDLSPALSHPDIGVGQVGIVVLPTKKAQYLKNKL